MSTTTMPFIDGVMLEANMRLIAADVSTMRFAAAENCTATHPILTLIDLTDGKREIARVDAQAIDTIMTANHLLGYVQCLCSAVNMARAQGRQEGVAEIRSRMRDAIGL